MLPPPQHVKVCRNIRKADPSILRRAISEILDGPVSRTLPENRPEPFPGFRNRPPACIISNQASEHTARSKGNLLGGLVV